MSMGQDARDTPEDTNTQPAAPEGAALPFESVEAVADSVAAAQAPEPDPRPLRERALALTLLGSAVLLASLFHFGRQLIQNISLGGMNDYVEWERYDPEQSSRERTVETGAAAEERMPHFMPAAITQPLAATIPSASAPPVRAEARPQAGAPAARQAPAYAAPVSLDGMRRR